MPKPNKWDRIARVIRDRKIAYGNKEEVIVCLTGLQYELANIFAELNPGFDKEKFRKACEIS